MGRDAADGEAEVINAVNLFNGWSQEKWSAYLNWSRSSQAHALMGKTDYNSDEYISTFNNVWAAMRLTGKRK